MNEEWRAVKGYEGLYEVSNLGNVRSLDHVWEYVRNGVTVLNPRKGKALKLQQRQHGYLCVQLHGRGGHKTRGFRTMSVHRLVAEAFIPNPLGLPEVNHLDEDKTNNRADNLEWCTHIENTNYGTCQQRRAAKQTNGSTSKAVTQFTLDGDFVATYPSMAEAERQTGFAAGNICYAINGRYSHAYGYKWKYAT